MKPIPVLGIPHFNRPDLLLRCLASIDYPVEHLVIIQNGLDKDMPPLVSVWHELDHLPPDHQPGQPVNDYVRHVKKLTVLKFDPQAGVAGAWNTIIKQFCAPWWLIANNDIRFAPGDLEKMGDCVTATMDKTSAAGLFYGNHGASWFGITAGCVALAGLFDENLYPAYLEDCDYARRCDLLGVARVNVPDCAAEHGDERLTGSCTVNATPELQQNNMRTHGGNFEYYRAKWGGLNGRETFSTPFNEPHWPIDFSRFDPFRRAKQLW